ncbi:hypothetical protein PsorP6_000362 [Peronosclerospora sorghi]|uniref:Uncharacterized protein n=1 Tax=Peronosclerospora sorghi TaxID=230839 RepID=A0ACC0WS31_9STRA|nr:hypothetical protein PsorP6_000362 [Peronosclerospora sorghi]
MGKSTKKRRINEMHALNDESDSPDTPQLAKFDSAMMQRQMELFLDTKDFDSVLLLGEFLVFTALLPSDLETYRIKSDTQVETNANLAFVDVQMLSPAFHAKTLRLYADLMLAKDMGVVTIEQELETKLKVARYYVKLNSIHEAIQVLKSTLPDKRSLSMNLLLGKLYLN